MLLHHRYQIIRDLAEGSFGKTFLAEDTQMPTRQRCVIKQLKPINDDRPDVVQLIQERFAREAAVLEAVGRGHSQIPSLLAYFETEGQFYLVQEWIEGVPLSDLVQTPWPEEKVAALLASALEALAHIHAQNLIHRDIKPDNIILRQSDQCPCLIDFGAVKELMNTVVVSSESQSSSVVIGTLGFMAPEQAVGRPVFSSDLYSLAMTAIFLLTARSPLEIPTDSMNGRLLWNQFAPDVNPRLAGILTRAIHPYPPTRFASATDMLAVLTAPSSSPVLPPVRATAEHTPSSPPQSPSPAIGTEISLPVSPAAQNSPATFIGSAETAIGLPALSTPPPLATSEAVLDSLAQDPVQSSVGGVPSGSSAPERKFGNNLKNGYYNTTPSREQQKENRTFLLKVGGIVLGSLLLVAALGGGYVALSGRLSVGEIDASSPETLEKAIAALEKKVEARPDNVVAQLGLIEGYVNRGEYDDALSQIDTLTQNSADDLETTAQALYWKGLVQTIQGDYAEAIATLTDSVAQDGNHIESIILLGTVYGGTGQYDTAIEHFQKAIALDPSYSTAYVRQAPTEELRGETETVEDLLSTAQPLLSTGQEIDFYSYRGNFYFGLGDLEKAEAAWEKTDTFSPEDANDYAAQGFSQGLLGNTAEAMDSFEQSLAINPNALNAYLFRASIHFRQEDFDKAAADVESALAINPRSMFAHQLNSNILVSRADPDLPAAISAVTKALNTDPNNPLVLRDRCAVHYLTNQFGNAIADCTQSLNTNPHNADVYALRGQSYFSQANHERADEDLSRAIELNEASGKQPTAFVYGARAVSRAELGDNAGAQADATKAIALDPNEPDYYKLRGMLRFIAEDQKGAGEDLKKAQDLYRAKGEEDAELNTILDSLEQLGIL